MIHDYEFINRKYAYDYPRAASTADAVVFRFDGERLYLLLIRRKNDPFKDCWAFPGGFLDMEETIDACCKRELEEETHITDAFIKQVGNFTDVMRDPRGRVLSTAYYALVRPDVTARADDDAAEVRWFPIDTHLALDVRNGGFDVLLKTLPPLAFDHARILRVTIQRLREDIHFRPIAFHLLGNAFTIPQAQRLYEQLLQYTFEDRRNFKRKLLSRGIVVPTGEKEVSHTHRCGLLYRFDEQAYVKMKNTNPFDLEF